MKKAFLHINIFIVAIISIAIIGMPSVAQEKPAKQKCFVYTYHAKKTYAQAAKDINIFLARYFKDLNTHNVASIGNYYASGYISNDGFNKNQVVDLTRQTWQKYPDIKYSTCIKNLRIQGNRASVEFTEKIIGNTAKVSEITNDNGIVTGFSHHIFYLQKFGSGWAIVTDKTLYEKALIKYGIAKTIDINLHVPEQISSGEEYTASLMIEKPMDVFALASISSVPIVYPAKSSEETFRQVPSSLNILERVIQANGEAYNEIVSASVSFCKIEKSYYTGLDLQVSGIAVILKRLNVLPERSI